MLQQVEYDPIKLLKWLATVPNIFKVLKRGKLVFTNTSKALLAIVLGTQIVLISITIALFVSRFALFAAIVFIATPLLLIVELTVISFIGAFILRIKRASLMRSAEKTFTDHQGQRIAVLGSYGKTSMKELLNTVLGAKFNVAMTPGNKNVAISHARWSTTLNGDEDILIIEYGEGEPGDIDELASLSHPTYAVVTGLAPNHLDHYKTIEAIRLDFKQISNQVDPGNIYVHQDNTGLVSGFEKSVHIYDESSIDGWRVTDIKVDISGVIFKMNKDKQVINIKSGLLGRHNIGALGVVAILAIKFGMTAQEVEQAMTLTKPFEHRMQPFMVNGAWVIDDAYNGNLEGFMAGLRLLSELQARRKIYVTPGLVDQGAETERVHKQIGEAIAKAKPDKVVLMKNSVVDIVHTTLVEAGYSGEIEVVDNPLEYYENIDQFVATGDLVMLQNDLPDAYR